MRLVERLTHRRKISMLPEWEKSRRENPDSPYSNWDFWKEEFENQLRLPSLRRAPVPAQNGHATSVEAPHGQVVHSPAVSSVLDGVSNGLNRFEAILSKVQDKHDDRTPDQPTSNGTRVGDRFESEFKTKLGEPQTNEGKEPQIVTAPQSTSVLISESEPSYDTPLAATNRRIYPSNDERKMSNKTKAAIGLVAVGAVWYLRHRRKHR